MNGREPVTRLDGLDELKGLCIVLVVLIHAAPDGPSWYGTHFVGGLARLAVPCFLLITGFLAGLKRTSRARLRSYFWKFLRLHVIYGVFYWIVSILLDGWPSSITLKSALLHFGEGSYAGQFYFIILLQVFFLSAFVLPEGFWRTRSAVILAALAAAAGLALLAVATPIIEARSLPRWAVRLLLNANWVWLWFYYFALGSLLGSRSRSAASDTARSKRVLGAATVLAAVALATTGFPAFPEWDAPHLSIYPYSRLAIFLGTSLIALELPSLASIRLARPVRALGVHSFGIYVLNPCILRVLFRLIGEPADPWVSWLYAAVTLVCALLLTRWLTRWAPFMVP